MNQKLQGTQVLRVLIIGCGNIAGGFDDGRLLNDWPYSHAGAYLRDVRYSVVACVEPDDDRRNNFMVTWKVPVGFRSIEELLDSGNQFDVVSICSPTQFHAHDIAISMRLKPKLIFCEKPVTSSLTETQQLVDECRNNNILLAVNYSRRFDPDIIKLKNEIINRSWGELRSVSGTYNKGILNNGSHMLDLLNFLVGKMEIIKVGKPDYDYFPTDPTVPVWLEGANELPVQLVCGNAKDYAFFELQLVFSQGVLTMEEGGMFWRERRAIDSATFKGYRVLDEGVRRIGSYPQSMLKAIDNVYDAIYQGKPLASTGETALAAQQICQLIKQQVCQ